VSCAIDIGFVFGSPVRIYSKVSLTVGYYFLVSRTVKVKFVVNLSMYEALPTEGFYITPRDVYYC